MVPVARLVAHTAFDGSLWAWQKQGVGAKVTRSAALSFQRVSFLSLSSLSHDSQRLSSARALCLTRHRLSKHGYRSKLLSPNQAGALLIRGQSFNGQVRRTRTFTCRAFVPLYLVAQCYLFCSVSPPRCPVCCSLSQPCRYWLLLGQRKAGASSCGQPGQ